MTPDEATLAAGRIIEIWDDQRRLFTEWQRELVIFDATKVARAIDHHAGQPTAPTIGLMLASVTGLPEPRKTSPEPTPPLAVTVPDAPGARYAGPDNHLATLVDRADQGDRAAILELDGWALMHARNPDRLITRLRRSIAAGDTAAERTLAWFIDRTTPPAPAEPPPPATHDDLVAAGLAWDEPASQTCTPDPAGITGEPATTTQPNEESAA